MAIEALKSGSISDLDSTPAIRDSAGAGGAYRVVQIDDYAICSAAATVGSTYKLVRIPSNAKVKSLKWETPGLGAGAFNVGLNYSDSAADGTGSANLGAVLNNNFFATDVDGSAAVNQVEIVNESGSYALNLRHWPIWQAAGLTADPGGFLDIVFTVHTTAVTTGGAIGCRLEYAE